MARSLLVIDAQAAKRLELSRMRTYVCFFSRCSVSIGRQHFGVSYCVDGECGGYACCGSSYSTPRRKSNIKSYERTIRVLLQRSAHIKWSTSSPLGQFYICTRSAISCTHIGGGHCATVRVPSVYAHNNCFVFVTELWIFSVFLV